MNNMPIDNPNICIPKLLEWALEHNVEEILKVSSSKTKDALLGLETLDISNKSISVVPSEIRYLTNLKELDLSHNQLTEFPQELVYLKKLKTLNLSWNKIDNYQDYATFTDNLDLNKNWNRN